MILSVMEYTGGNTLHTGNHTSGGNILHGENYIADDAIHTVHVIYSRIVHQ